MLFVLWPYMCWTSHSPRICKMDRYDMILLLVSIHMREKRREPRSKKKSVTWMHEFNVLLIDWLYIDCSENLNLSSDHDTHTRRLSQGFVDWLTDNVYIYIWIQCLPPLAFCLILNICVSVAFFECQHPEISSLADFTTFIYRSDLWNLMCDMYNIYRSKKKSTDKMKITVYAMTYVSWFF
jgi:hypothetical protein